MENRYGVYAEASRTHQNRGQASRGVHNSVEGTAVRKVIPQQEEPVRLDKRKKTGITASQRKALKRQRRIFVALGIAAGLVVIGLAGLMLITANKKSELASLVSVNESTLSSLSVSNAAKEYEINNSIDLNEIIKVATEELGMVRVNASQIVTYSTNNSEYLLQVAAVPTE